jgi:hypothetical protein
MALLSEMDITVCQRRVDSGTYKQSGGGQSGQRKTKVTAKTKYLVVVKEKSGGPAISPSDLNPLLIVNAVGLPKIGRSCYSFGGLVAPFLLCNSKQIDRDSENGFVFHVSADWESIEVGVGGGGQSGEQTPQEALEPKDQSEVTPESLEKEVVVSFTTSSQEFVRYDSAFLNGRGSRQSWKLPTGTPFEEPVVAKSPLITISITQFEDDITLTSLEERSFAINSEEWNGRGFAQWMCAEVEATQVVVNIGMGEQEKWRVTYNVHLAPKHNVECVVQNEPRIIGQALNVGDVYSPGWGVLRPLVDTFYKKEDAPPVGPPGPDYLVPNADPETGYVEACYIYEATGRKRTPTSTDGTGDDRPSYMAFMPQKSIDFNTFLKWPK